jgi:hypothetical protein
MALNQYNVTQIKTHVIDALNRLLMQYAQNISFVLDNQGNIVVDNNGDPTFSGPLLPLAARIFNFAQRFQMAEDIFYALYTQTNLANAIGATLDRWGVLLETPRGGLDDNLYRANLYLVIIEYVSKGSIETLIQIYSQLTGASKVILFELFPARFQLTAIDANPVIPISGISTVIQRTKAGGVGFNAVIGGQNSFGFLGNPLAFPFGAEDGSGNNLGIGGQFTGLIS